LASARLCPDLSSPLFPYTTLFRSIPLFLAVSTGIGVIASLVFGRLYDSLGLPIVLVAVLLSSLFAPLVFLGGFFVALAGLVLWRSEEHTSELQSLRHLVCRLLLDN